MKCDQRGSRSVWKYSRNPWQVTGNLAILIFITIPANKSGRVLRDCGITFCHVPLGDDFCTSPLVVFRRLRADVGGRGDQGADSGFAVPGRSNEGRSKAVR